MTTGFESFLRFEVGAEVTHPPGTTFDDDGNPIPPPENHDEDNEE